MANRRNSNTSSANQTFEQIITEIDLPQQQHQHDDHGHHQQQHQHHHHHQQQHHSIETQSENIEIPIAIVNANHLHYENSLDCQNNLHANEDIFQIILRRLDEIEKRNDENYLRLEERLTKIESKLLHQIDMIRKTMPKPLTLIKQSSTTNNNNNNHPLNQQQHQQNFNLTSNNTNRKTITSTLRSSNKHQTNGQIIGSEIIILTSNPNSNIDHNTPNSNDNIIDDNQNYYDVDEKLEFTTVQHHNNDDNNDDHHQQSPESIKNQKTINNDNDTPTTITPKTITKRSRLQSTTNNEIKRLKCDTCDFQCNFNSSLSRHRRTHIDHFPHPCKYCELRFRRLDNLKVHVKRKHKQEDEMIN